MLTKQEVEVYFQSVEGKAHLAELTKITPETVTPWLETEEGKRAIQPKIGLAVEKGIKTWRETTLPGIISQEVARVHPNETPAGKAAREANVRIEKLERQILMGNNKTESIAELLSLGLPIDLADYVTTEDKETTSANIKRIKVSWDANMKKSVENKFAENGLKPPSNVVDQSTIDGKIAASVQSGNTREEIRLLMEKSQSQTKK